MAEIFCVACGSTRELTVCSLCVYPQKYCVTCLQRHSHGEAVCYDCRREAVVTCVTCAVLICEEHVEEHKTSCLDCQLYPIPSREGTRVSPAAQRKSMMLDELKTRIEQQLTDWEQQVKSEIEQKIEELHQFLIWTKSELNNNIETEFREIRKEFTESLQRIAASDSEASTNRLETLFHSSQYEEILSILATDIPVSLRTNSQLLPQVPNSLFRIERTCSSLLESSSNACSEQLYLLLAEPLVAVDLSNKNIRQLPIVLPCADAAVWTAMDDGRFLVVSPFGSCFLIDKFLTTYDEMLCLSFRNHPGLVSYGPKAFLFGGEVEGENSRTAEVLNVLSKRSFPISESMQSARKLFSPCVFKEKIVLAGGVFTEIFDPVTEHFELTAIQSQFQCAFVSFPFPEEVIIVSNRELSLNLAEGRLDALSNQPCAVVSTGACARKWRDEWYFLAIAQGKLIIAKMNIGTFQIKVELGISQA